MNKTLKSCIGLILIIFLVIIGAFLLAWKLTGINQFESVRSIVTNFLGIKADVKAHISITPLLIDQQTKTLLSLKNSASYTVKSNKEISLSKESTRIKMILSTKLKDLSDITSYWYVVEVDTLGIGDNNISFDVKDGEGNTQNLQVVITRQGYNLPFGLDVIKDWDSSTYTALGDNLKALVNKQYKLPMDYAPKVLLDIHKDLLLYTNSAQPFMIRQDAGESLKLMANDLYKQKVKNLVITSAYRDYNEQYKVYANWVRQLGQSEADKISARPGFSEHQLGTAVDFVDQETGLDLTNNFDNGVAGKWLKDNAYKYGFIQSYPEGKQNLTGYQHEAWHYRYVGIENSTKIFGSGLTLKQWLEQNQ